MVTIGKLVIATFGVALCEPALAQGVMPFPFAASSPMRDAPVASREPWSATEHASAVTNAIAAAVALPERASASMQLRLAATLEAAGDNAQAAELLRQAAGKLYRPGAPLREIAERLVVAGEIGAAQKLAADTSGNIEKQQILAGMLEGALKAKRLDLGIEVLRVANRLPHAATFDAFAGQAKTLADALAKAGRFKQALSVFPTPSSVFGPSDLAALATQACAADPSLAGEAGHLLAVAALERAGARSGPPPIQEVQAFETCKGQPAARHLVEAMPPDVAHKLASRHDEPASSETPSQLASEASAASRSGDVAAADRLFAAAGSRLDAELPDRGASPDRRRAFDKAAGQVSTFLLQADRPAPALALSARLPATERLPILFDLAGIAIRTKAEPGPFLEAIDAAFDDEPALIEVEAGEIRALRGALPLGSAVYSKIEVWLRKLPVEPVAPSLRSTPALAQSRAGMNDLPTTLLAAAEKAAPSVRTVRQVLEETRRGEVARAITEAKALTLTPSETGFVDVTRAFVEALQSDLLAPLGSYSGIEGLSLKRSVTATAADSLLLAVERTALGAHNTEGARDAFAAIDKASPLKGPATATLAIAEAQAGFPHEAFARLGQVEDPVSRFSVLRAIVAIKTAP